MTMGVSFAGLLVGLMAVHAPGAQGRRSGRPYRAKPPLSTSSYTNPTSGSGRFGGSSYDPPKFGGSSSDSFGGGSTGSSKPSRHSAPNLRRYSSDGNNLDSFHGHVQSYTITNEGSCSAHASSEAWAGAADAWAEAMVDAVAKGPCKGDFKKTYDDLHGKLQANAFASIWLKTTAQCKTQGAAVGCAASNAGAKAMAKAAYDAWVRAYAKADLANKCSKCLTDAFSSGEVVIEAWGEIFAKAQGRLKSKTCNTKYNEGQTLAEAELECWSNINAHLWGQAIAGAWKDGHCDEEEGHHDQTCDAKCLYAPSNKNTDCRKDCKEKEAAYTEAYVAAWLDVEITKDKDCWGIGQEIGHHALNKVVKAKAHGGVTDGSIVGLQEGECVAHAQTKGKASSWSVFLQTHVNAAKDKCHKNKWYSDDYDAKLEYGMAKAVAEAYVDVLAACWTADGTKHYNGNVMGCAFSYGSMEAIADASAQGITAAWASAKVGAKEHCNCEQDARAKAHMGSYFGADLWAGLLVEAEADLYGANGEFCSKQTDEVGKQVIIDCIAYAAVHLVQEAWAEAFIEGKCTGQPVVCESCKVGGHCGASNEFNNWDDCAAANALYADAYVGMIQEAQVEVQPGYCTVDPRQTDNNKPAWWYIAADATLVQKNYYD